MWHLVKAGKQLVGRALYCRHHQQEQIVSAGNDKMTHQPLSPITQQPCPQNCPLPWSHVSPSHKPSKLLESPIPPRAWVLVTKSCSRCQQTVHPLNVGLTPHPTLNIQSVQKNTFTFYNKFIWVVFPRTGKMSKICHIFFLWSFTVTKRFYFFKFSQLF